MVKKAAGNWGALPFLRIFSLGKNDDRHTESSPSQHLFIVAKHYCHLFSTSAQAIAY